MSDERRSPGEGSERAALPVRLIGKPARHTPPSEYHRSFGRLGIRAQRGKLIEIRAPNGEGDWPRTYVDSEAAERLLEWLPEALAFATGEDEEAAP